LQEKFELKEVGDICALEVTQDKNYGFYFGGEDKKIYFY
jgi:hypothetical protein